MSWYSAFRVHMWALSGWNFHLGAEYLPNKLQRQTILLVLKPSSLVEETFLNSSCFLLHKWRLLILNERVKAWLSGSFPPSAHPIFPMYYTNLVPSNCPNISMIHLKNYHPGMWRKVADSTFLVWVTRCVTDVCASTQSVDSVSANRRISLRSVSMLQKTILFHPFLVHNIYANRWLFTCSETSKTNYPYLEKLIEYEN